ncbi:MAG: hypothetical protein GY814_05965 [Gammaproteobacteria bacterium]|nr:hypothetical protein [Gammaproteobacteria bacterium]
MNSACFKSGSGSVAVILCVACLLLSAPVFSDSVEDGFVAFKQGDKELAYKNWLPLAIQGDVRAQFFLSVLYEQWAGGAEDRKNAKRWLTASANNGFVPARFNLGNNYHLGKYGRVNNKMAAHWWQQAAIQGFVEAQYYLGTIYYWGEGIELDLEESLYWFEKAARSGSQLASAAMLQVRAGSLERDKIDPVNIAYDDPRIVSRLSAMATDNTELSVTSDSLPEQPEIAVVSGPPAAGGVEGQGGVAPGLVQKKLMQPGQQQEMGPKPEQSHGPDLNWVQQQPAENRTIQLFASGRMQHCEGYVGELWKSYQLQAHAYALALKRRKLCAVVYGNYPKLSEAMASMRQLPPKLRRSKPWVRKLGKLQRLAR